MPFATPRWIPLAVALLAGPASAQVPTTVFTVNSAADDANARDRTPGDGVCLDTFTESNPSAEPRCTLRAAVDEANATPGPVVINLPGQLAGGVSGTYTLSRVAPNVAAETYEDGNAYGDLDLGAGAAAFSSLTIRGTGTPGPQVTVSPNDRVFHLLSNEVRIERVTITGGTAQPGANGVSSPGPGQSVDGADGADGGCVLVAAGVTALLDQVSVNNCATSSGGNGTAPSAGIAQTRGGNAGRGGDGGGIANYGALTLRRSFVAQNETGDAGSPGFGTAPSSGAPADGGNGGSGGSGAGVYNEGTLSVERSTIANNVAGDPSAGAAGTNGGQAGAEGEGGAGGGVASVNGGETTLTNTIVASNTAGSDTRNDGTTTAATKQPGSDLYDGSVADDDAGPGPNPFTTGLLVDRGFNLIGTNSSVEAGFPDVQPGAAVDQNGSRIGSGQASDATRINPVVIGANRGAGYAVTAYELGAASPAIDAADPAIGADAPALDGRGFLRPGIRSGDERADIGAFEFASRPVSGDLVISEVDAVTPPLGEGDAAEFVEIQNVSDVPAQLADYALVFFNGADNLAYAQFNLQGVLAPGEVYVVSDPGVAAANQAVLGGAPNDVVDGSGAVALYLGKASDYPNGAAAGQNASTRADVLIYDNAVTASRRAAPSGSLASAFGVPEDQVASGDTEEASIQRTGNGSYAAAPPTPGSASAGGGVAGEGGPDEAVDLAVTSAPNPTSGRALIAFGAAEAGDAQVAVYDVLGRRVAVLASGPVERGRHEVAFDASGVPSGVYVVRATVGDETQTVRITVAR
ncbi:T9SS type A sorting domain-containing protein [Rubrivirga sp. S365]|uniref:T9SS type A sorting domain-containing protein n=1 Tax=Rubrivirga litoralis TaxID=3075598 RepID=A0ABU3BM01_9BACT|nr:MULTISPECIES: T9SS type A sorting domain-containing protein [unclassified Rubrivirga]MDT0630311.1 T9SS type A sorting domain-containing protein [Rubrivirga sp. F394]MDT7855823.1 T9SS type A sorting domain-containing protein [Rubrivirga sp. S365]